MKLFFLLLEQIRLAKNQLSGYYATYLGLVSQLKVPLFI